MPNKDIKRKNNTTEGSWGKHLRNREVQFHTSTIPVYAKYNEDGSPVFLSYLGNSKGHTYVKPMPGA